MSRILELGTSAQSYNASVFQLPYECCISTSWLGKRMRIDPSRPRFDDAMAKPLV